MKRFSTLFFGSVLFPVLLYGGPLPQPKITIRTPIRIVANQWYYVSAAGTSQGPVSFEELRRLFRNRIITTGSFLWNGTTVTEWTQLSQLPDLLKKLSTPEKPPIGKSPIKPRFPR